MSLSKSKFWYNNCFSKCAVLLLMLVAPTLLDYKYLIIMPEACKELDFWKGEGDRENRKKVRKGIFSK
jgi:hypothetical protein